MPRLFKLHPSGSEKDILDSLKTELLSEKSLDDIVIELEELQDKLAKHASRLGYRNYVDDNSWYKPEKGVATKEINLLLEYKEAKYQLEVYDLVRQMSETNYLCSKCDGISLANMQRPDTFAKRRDGGSSNNNDGGYVHYATFEELERSAIEDKCKCCMLLWIALSHANSVKRPRAAWEVQSPIRLQSSTSQVQVYCSHRSVEDVSLGLLYSPEALARQDSEPDQNPGMPISSRRTRLTAADPLSDECITLLRTWLDNCINHHDHCLRNTNCQLPTRVIDVGNPSGTEQPRLLVTGSATQSSTAYIALSHCWGGIVPLRTLRANLAAHQRELPLASLPRTFRDAVTLTRRLGFRYLWIDSLCIVQDDEDDWSRESARMCDIYHHSVLTLSARSAANSADGLLVPRDPNATAVFEPLADGGEVMMTYPPPNLGSNFVSSRGWTLQELLLSSRVVHYTYSKFGGDRMMIWECQTTREKEDGAAFWDETKSMLLALDERPGANKYNMDPRDVWYHAVAEFSRRELTKIADRLPAMSGITDIIQKKMEHDGINSTFVAGMWAGDDLVHRLLWTAPVRQNSSMDMFGSEPAARALDVAPSWSWASAAGNVSWGKCTQLKHSTESSPWLEEDDHDPPPGIPKAQHFPIDIVGLGSVVENKYNKFGRVRPGAFIRISGKMREVRIPPWILRTRREDADGYAITCSVAFKDGETRDHAFATYPGITERDARRIWEVIDMIFTVRVGSHSLSTANESIWKSTAAGLTLDFREILKPFVSVERTLRGLTSQLAVHPTTLEEEQLERFVRLVKSAQAQIEQCQDPSRQKHVEMISRDSYRFRLDRVLTPIDLLYPYLYLQSLMMNETFDDTPLPPRESYEWVNVDKEWPPLDLSHIPESSTYLGDGQQQDFPTIESPVWPTDHISVRFDDGEWRLDSLITDQIWCLLLTDSCIWENSRIAPRGLALVRVGQENGEDVFRRVGVFLMSEPRSELANNQAKQAFQGVKKRGIKIT